METRKKVMIIGLFVIFCSMIAIYLSLGNVDAGDNFNHLSKEKRLENTYYTQPIHLKEDHMKYDCDQGDGLLKSKRYTTMNELEEQLQFRVLHSPYFSDNNSKIVFIKSTGFAEIYCVSENTTNEKDIYAFLENTGNRPYLKMSIITDDREKGCPTEYLGYYRLKEPFKAENGIDINLIEEYSEHFGNKRYTIVLKKNNIVYTVENIESITNAKEIANSFSK